MSGAAVRVEYCFLVFSDHMMEITYLSLNLTNFVSSAFFIDFLLKKGKFPKSCYFHCYFTVKSMYLTKKHKKYIYCNMLKI